MGLFKIFITNNISERRIKTVYNRKFFNKKELYSVMIDDDSYYCIETGVFDRSQSFNSEEMNIQLLKNDSKFILLNGIDLSDKTFGDILFELKYDEAIKYALESLEKNENIVLYMEKFQEEEIPNIRYVIFKFRDKDISHVESFGHIRGLLEDTLKEKEIPDFPFIEVIPNINRVQRLLRLKK